MQPSPIAETSGPMFPSLRFCIALQYRFPEANDDPGADEHVVFVGRLPAGRELPAADRG
jgi:hypothetical protein